MDKADQVSVWDMAEARDERALRQRTLLAKYGAPLVSYTLNIAGPIKRFSRADRCFSVGKVQIEAMLKQKGFSVLECIGTDEKTGLAALWAVKGSAEELKTICTDLEEKHPLGRLFDIDILNGDGQQLSRRTLGFSERGCLICGNAGPNCARERLHPLEEIVCRTEAMLDAYFVEEDAQQIAKHALSALLYELSATPKPGLVDRFNNGAHSDMNFFTFLDSAIALGPHFHAMAKIGALNRALPAEDLLPLLRSHGIQAEAEMFATTGGVNTHKGAIFSLGILAAASGYLGLPISDPDTILSAAARIAAPAMQSDLGALTPQTVSTHGEEIFVKYGLTGIRGEAAAGFPSVRLWGLPALRHSLAEGYSLGEAGIATLLHLMAHVEDTNLIRRGGLSSLKLLQDRLLEFLTTQPDQEAILAYAADLDLWCIQRNLSPGGSADLLAVTYLLHFITK
ncbi:MAG: triphosphoribosyl-dephospho-CoA synthase CitG [Oscillospiraceae bacterium]|nr:triphosphoribosyl-dephospho-CoA synthase CitG [Oscillospiraceae bacterium]